jgi:hypothetical protein
MPETRDRKGKRAGRRSRGLGLKERDGFWHAVGTIRVGGRSIRVRRSLGLPATAEYEDAAWTEVDAIREDVIAEAQGKSGRGDPVAVAARAYLTFPRERPLGPAAISIVKEITIKFGRRRLNAVSHKEWKTWVEARQAGNKATTRERFLNGVVAFQRFAHKHHGLAALTDFARDKKARNPIKRARRPVKQLRPELLALLFDSCHIAIRAQLVAEWSTGARTSSIFYGCVLADLILAPGREQITFHDTKNGKDVPAALSPYAAGVMRDYLNWRGALHDRDGALFLTPQGRPYKNNGKAWGGQNKTGFNGAKRRARRTLLKRSFEASRAARRAGHREQALSILLEGRADVRLLRKVTQHWFRHLLATRMAHLDLRSTMDQGGWDDHRSVLGYVHDVPERRRALVAQFDDFGTSLTRASDSAPETAAIPKASTR